MNFLTVDYRRTMIRKPSPILSGLDAWLYRLVGRLKNRHYTTFKFLELAKKIDQQSSFWREMSDEDLRGKLLAFKEIFRRRKKGYEDVLPQALGAIREAAARRLGMRPYLVQLAAAFALYQGYVIEMATGEGKTLVAALAGVLQGWSGLPCHIITVNDYLAQRDAEWMGPLYWFCGVSVGYVTSEMEPEARREGYFQEVTYTTSKEIIADFLRDRLWLGDLQDIGRRQVRALLGHQSRIEKGLVMRGIYSAIVDEADSILIDEAVTPLIISRSSSNRFFVEACKVANELADTLKVGIDYKVNYKYNEIELNPEVEERLRKLAENTPDISSKIGARAELIRQALSAREFFHPDNKYVIQDGKVVIVDEFTGRLMPHRRWNAGLHQLIEAKEKLPLTPPEETLARLSFQRFYRFFPKLSGMTGTARESVSEFWHIYNLAVVYIPENKPCQRKIYPPLVFADQNSKWQAILEEVVLCHQKGRPVLVGTRSVEASERFSLRLKERNLPHRVLNAVRHREEARIIAHAGEKGAITIATNMAGRGTDIRLGCGVAELGGLHVIAAEPNEAQRIDRQLFGRCARQGDPGSARLFVSMEDEVIRKYLPESIRRSLKVALRYKLPGASGIAISAVKLAQSTAQRLAFHRRCSVLRMDTWLDDSLSFAYREID